MPGQNYNSMRQRKKEKANRQLVQVRRQVLVTQCHHQRRIEIGTILVGDKSSVFHLCQWGCFTCLSCQILLVSRQILHLSAAVNRFAGHRSLFLSFNDYPVTTV